jgi:prevent-host-death family protein
MRVLNLYEAKTRLSALVEEAAAGGEIVIAKAGVPRARLVPVGSRTPRRPGGSNGRVWISRDFDGPLPEDLLEQFEGKSDSPDGGGIKRRRSAKDRRSKERPTKARGTVR